MSPMSKIGQGSSTPVLFKNGAFLVVKPGFEINAPSHVSREKKAHIKKFL